MSKRLFILGSLLETHPRRASAEARMGTPVIVEPQIRLERGRPAGGAPIGGAVRPLAQQRLNKALGLAVGLRPVGTREALPNGPAATHGREDTGFVREGVVGEQATDGDATSSKPRQGA